ncbi:hypothetical protein THAOC_32744 [Thalassiosira oceanica]|uniref:Glycosyltransferase n=1 Tax=Thalassiosira oceanica TaxID=159749 RepID=K0RHM9_THAOC|nr:hypothetical protein THAOC_32744 [Thalassiosira oceanica]|eukprot:EJK48456.1 hypothetical protein THAOC_32744 [Thalassiosira oceanica]
MSRSFRRSTSNLADDGAVLFLSPTSWPQPNATAAGTRTMALLRHFAESSDGPFSSVHFGCGAGMPDSLAKQASDHEQTCRIKWHHIKANRGQDMKELLESIGSIRAVVFDRFYSEEAFSFRIREICPDALLVLDMQDIHSLRIGRQCLVDEMTAHHEGQGLTDDLVDSVMSFDPANNLSHPQERLSKRKLKANDSFMRELASVHRCDMTLVCSPAEIQFMRRWGVPEDRMTLAPFFCEPSSGTSMPTFDERADFVAVGGFKHPPNVDSVRLLRNEIWPKIRARLPGAKINIYGAYPTQSILSLDNKSLGFRVHGHVIDLDEVLLGSRVLLAPLRYGAGIKGKVVDAWRNKCPVVTTPIGSEGIGDARNWGGLVESNSDDFADAAVRLYTDQVEWGRRSEVGGSFLQGLFEGQVNLQVVREGIDSALSDMHTRRRTNIFGSMLWHQSNRSTEYFSRWIELKESKSG